MLAFLLLHTTLTSSLYLPASSLATLTRSKLRRIRYNNLRRTDQPSKLNPPSIQYLCSYLPVHSLTCLSTFTRGLAADLRNIFTGRQGVLMGWDVQQNPGPQAPPLMPCLHFAKQFNLLSLSGPTGGKPSTLPAIQTILEETFQKRNLRNFETWCQSPKKSTGITFCTFNIQGAGGMTLERWSNTLLALLPTQADIVALQEYQPLFPLPEAATADLCQTYTLLPHQVTGPSVAFLVKKQQHHFTTNCGTTQGLEWACHLINPVLQRKYPQNNQCVQ